MWQSAKSVRVNVQSTIGNGNRKRGISNEDHDPWSARLDVGVSRRRGAMTHCLAAQRRGPNANWVTVRDVK
jgi:hypothetical protein